MINCFSFLKEILLKRGEWAIFVPKLYLTTGVKNVKVAVRIFKENSCYA